MENRCAWAGSERIYTDYHDFEWGIPVADRDVLFESLILESFQAGLSWITILKKREGFRAAFHGFDPQKMAVMGADDVERLLKDPGIIRHRGKIEAAINSAKALIALEETTDFAVYLWGFVGGTPIQNNVKSLSDVPGSTDISKALSKDLKKRGFGFCGPTTVYAFMQAVGMVNDHTQDCPCHKSCVDQAKGFKV